MIEDKKGVPVQPVETLAGEDLNRAFSESIRWLRSVAECRWLPRKLYHFPKGTIHMPDPERMSFQVNVNVDDGSEVYHINAGSGLVSLKRKTKGEKIESSILGELQFTPNYRYFVTSIRKEEVVYLGTRWVGDDDEPHPDEDWSMEEMKRAAIKVVRVCQG